MDTFNLIFENTLNGNANEVTKQTEKAFNMGMNLKEILNKALMPAMDEVGRRFEAGDIFVPEMLMAAEAMRAGMEKIRPLIVGDMESIGTIVLGTVQGDVHDLGKNLVGMMLEGAGFKIIDLGIDVSAETYIYTLQKEKASLLAMSSLLTTTMPYMAEVIERIAKAKLRGSIGIMVGGSPVTPDFAKSIGADLFAQNAAEAARIARSYVLNK